MAAAGEYLSESESDDSWFSDPEEVQLFRHVPWQWSAELATLDQVGEVVKNLKVPRKKIRVPVKKVADNSSGSEVPPTYLSSEAESTDSSQASSDSTRPLPKKQRRKDGTWEFVHYVPVWTDPEWNDMHEIVPGEPGPDGGPPEPTMRFDRVKGDMHYNLRPALLAKDALKNPTEFAKRWGIGRGRTDGRSGLSPTNAMARRVLLSKPMHTPDGKLKDHLNIDDLRASQMQFLQTNLAQQGTTFAAFLQNIAQSHDERGEQAQGLLALLNIIQADTDYQRSFFMGFSTDELMAQNALEFSTDFDSDLRGPIHDLFQRINWLDQEQRGQNSKQPRFVYNLEGVRGEWSAHDDNVWKAMQPALQLCTKILNSNHPAIETMLDIYTRTPIPDEEDSRRSDIKALSIPNRVRMSPDADINSTWLENIALRELGFDWKAVTLDYLMDNLVFCFNSVHWDIDGDKTPHSVVYGLTHRVDRSPRIIIQIGAELLWPLMSSTYTMSEKANCSFMLASTILHELMRKSDAIHETHLVILGYQKAWLRTRPDEDDISQEVRDRLKDLSSYLFCNKFGEPFWEKEWRSENGYTVENQLWGGPPLGLAKNGFHDMSIQPTVLKLDNWPFAMPRPHEAKIWTPREHQNSILSTPPSITNIYRPIPGYFGRRCFTTAFWDTQVAKFGHHALRMREEESQAKITVFGMYWRRKDQIVVFGKKTYQWMSFVRFRLREAKLYVISEYLEMLTEERVGFRWVAKKWHHEKKTWTHKMEKVDKMTEDLTQVAKEFMNAYYILMASAQRQRDIVDSMLATLRDKAARGIDVSRERVPDVGWLQASSDKAATLNLHRALGQLESMHTYLRSQVEYAQQMTFEYLQLPALRRLHLKGRYGDLLADVLRTSLEPAAIAALRQTVTFAKLLQRAGVLNAAYEQTLTKLRNKFNNDRVLLQETVKYLEADARSIDAGWRSTFVTLAAKTRQEKLGRLERLATREYNRLPADSPVRKVVDMYHRIVLGTQNVANFARDTPDIAALSDQLQAVKDIAAQPQAAQQQAAAPAASRVPKSNVKHQQVRSDGTVVRRSAFEMAKGRKVDLSHHGGPPGPRSGSQPQTYHPAIQHPPQAENQSRPAGFTQYAAQTSGFPAHPAQSIFTGQPLPVPAVTERRAGTFVPFPDIRALPETMSADLANFNATAATIVGADMLGEVAYAADLAGEAVLPEIPEVITSLEDAYWRAQLQKLADA